MVNKMNRSMVAETPEEKKMEALLNEARNSEEIVKFAENLKEDLKCVSPIFYSYRVKKVHSAVRSFRIAKYTKLESMHDLFGILIVVENKKDIRAVAQIIKQRLTDYTEYNLLNEKDWLEQKEEKDRKDLDYRSDMEIYERMLMNLKRIMAHTENLEKVLPPLSYIIASKIKMGDKEIPVEFRIQSKNGFQVLEASYFTVYKNDELNANSKGPLLFLIQQILNRKVELDTNKNLTKLEREELLNQIGDLYQCNFNITCMNRELLEDVWREYMKISVKYKLQLPVYDFHFFGEKEKTEEIMELIDNSLDELFEKYKSYDIREINTAAYVEHAVRSLKIEALV